MASSLADTSGTYGQTIFDVTSIIEHAVRRCGVSAAVITSEQQASARENLFLILSNLATRGLSLWCVSRLLIGIAEGKSTYDLPVGTVDVLKLLLRNATRTDATSVGAGIVALNVPGALRATSALITPDVPGTYELVLEGSTNGGATWVEAGRTVAVFDSDPIGVEATRIFSAEDWRVRDVRDPARLLAAGVFLSNANDLPMSKLTRDDYATYPDKAQESSWPLQYWYDKQFYRPRVVLWPVPSAAAAMYVFVQTQIQDPGTFTDAVQIPQRWIDAVIALLAPRVCLELPASIVPPDRYDKLERVAAQTLIDAENSETDGAPMRLAPAIGCYTR